MAQPSDGTVSQSSDIAAKQPISPLAGPYGHPFHPIFVTVPIGAWVAAFVFDVGSRTAEQPEVFTRGASWLLLIGIVGALAAAFFGFLDLLAIPTGTPAFRTGVTHMILNLVVLALQGIGYALRQGRLDHPDGTPVSLIVLAGVALAVLGGAGWLGGKLAYRYGVRVVDEAAQADGFR